MLLKDIQFLDDATRPPIPRLEGLTDAQKAPGEHLKQIHDHLRDNMVVLGRLIARASEGKATAEEVKAETADLVMVSNYRRFGTLCGQYCQFVHGHHSIEDQAVFPAIAAQGPAFKAIADRLQAEHVVVHTLLEKLIDALVALADAPGADNFETAVTVFRALEKVLLSHLHYEEDAIGDALGYYEIM
ncbi:hemerythrin domain-containing protein [Devosia sp. XJ19-1]|uniref:Hemerythrin domain-containing protein n=1 Tax=Devosia ureilytica TaxID=2952754 RepID=A0A9Q4ARN9_9HYPH|nr:hemerythrin domain-containing protein [Devosia ureilytica]MCP8885023.1 hemerythrin domain-containing protein [Devosia ureilytica]MCP8888466.1 hemerythrin domain-containing protein [Devosia ureilytica]